MSWRQRHLGSPWGLLRANWAVALPASAAAMASYLLILWVWSEAPILTRCFLWALTKFVSRRMNQLNFPISSLELASGMSNDILPMVSESGERVYTGERSWAATPASR